MAFTSPLQLNMNVRLFTRIFLFSSPSIIHPPQIPPPHPPTKQCPHRRDSRDTSPSDMDPSRRPRYKPKTGSRFLTALTLTTSLMISDAVLLTDYSIILILKKMFFLRT